MLVVFSRCRGKIRRTRRYIRRLALLPRDSNSVLRGAAKENMENRYKKRARAPRDTGLPSLDRDGRRPRGDEVVHRVSRADRVTTVAAIFPSLLPALVLLYPAFPAVCVPFARRPLQYFTHLRKGRPRRVSLCSLPSPSDRIRIMMLARVCDLQLNK